MITDENGRAQVPVKLPDNLTRYRIMALAVAGDNQFGSSEENLTARLPLMVRPSAPRFLNYGDVFELPVVLQNQTDEPMEVDIAVETVNLTMTGSPGARVTVPANDRVEVRFPAEAASAGTARVRIAAVSGAYADAATVNFPFTPLPPPKHSPPTVSSMKEPLRNRCSRRKTSFRNMVAWKSTPPLPRCNP